MDTSDIPNQAINCENEGNLEINSNTINDELGALKNKLHQIEVYADPTTYEKLQNTKEECFKLEKYLERTINELQLSTKENRKIGNELKLVREWSEERNSAVRFLANKILVNESEKNDVQSRMKKLDLLVSKRNLEVARTQRFFCEYEINKLDVFRKKVVLEGSLRSIKQNLIQQEKKCIDIQDKLSNNEKLVEEYESKLSEFVDKLKCVEVERDVSIQKLNEYENMEPDHAMHIIDKTLDDYERIVSEIPFNKDRLLDVSANLKSEKKNLESRLLKLNTIESKCDGLISAKNKTNGESSQSQNILQNGSGKKSNNPERRIKVIASLKSGIKEGVKVSYSDVEDVNNTTPSQIKTSQKRKIKSGSINVQSRIKSAKGTNKRKKESLGSNHGKERQSAANEGVLEEASSKSVDVFPDLTKLVIPPETLSSETSKSKHISDARSTTPPFEYKSVASSTRSVTKRQNLESEIQPVKNTQISDLNARHLEGNHEVSPDPAKRKIVSRQGKGGKLGGTNKALYAMGAQAARAATKKK